MLLKMGKRSKLGGQEFRELEKVAFPLDSNYYLGSTAWLNHCGVALLVCVWSSSLVCNRLYIARVKSLNCCLAYNVWLLPSLK